MLNRAPSRPGQRIRTTCPYCGVGCGVVVERHADGPVSIEGDHEHPANAGHLCSKGSALGETLDLDGRLLYPEISGRRAGWTEALDLVSDRFKRAIAEHGPDAVAFYVSGQLLTEDYYVANKLMKGFIGSANIDTNSRLCMASSVAGHRRAFGADMVPGLYADLEQADLVVLVGSNLAWCHPVLYRRLHQAKAERPDLKVVLIDPRRTMTADLADLHLPIVPDGDIALFAGLLNALADRGVVDETYVRSFTNGFKTVRQTVAGLSVNAVAQATGIRPADIATFYDWFATTDKTVTVYSQGVNQSIRGTDKVNAIINCHLATGRIGKPGMGPFSVTGQPNAMGGREVGGLANMLAAHMDLDNPQHRDIVRRFWKAPAVAESPGLKAVDLFRAVGDGRIKALWIMATNPVDSLPDADAVRAAIEACPFVVVSDVMAQTDTVLHADVKLPSTAWGEKNGTVTNSERCISRQRAFLSPPGEARPDWWQLTEVARRMGFADAFAYEDVSAIFREHAALSAFENGGTRDFDIGAYAALSPRGYRDFEPSYWPQPAGEKRGASRFFGQGGFYTADGKARFVPTPPGAPPAGSTEFPFILNTGRVRDQWHTMTRTAKSQRLSSHVAEPFVEIHPQDATKLGIDDAEIAEVTSSFGRALVRVLITERQQQGCVFVPIHWTDQFAAKGRIGALVPAATDAVSGQPAAKAVAVSVRRFEAQQFGFAICTRRPRLPDVDYWALAKCHGGWRVELAFAAPVDDPQAFVSSLFGVDSAAQLDLSAYRDTHRGDHRLALYDNRRFLGKLYLSAQPVAVSRAWAIEQMVKKPVEAKSRHHLIAGRPGVDQPDPGPIVCACHGVGANDIASCVASGTLTVDKVGETLGAGTNCGSCRAEIGQIINEYRPAPAE